jgi:hypothetical protein
MVNDIEAVHSRTAIWSLILIILDMKEMLRTYFEVANLCAKHTLRLREQGGKTWKRCC